MTRESRTEAQRRRYQADPERHREYLRKSYEKNRVKRCAEKRAQREADVERARAYAREQYAKHKEKRAADAKRRREPIKEELAAKAREKYRANREAMNARAQELRQRPEARAKAGECTRQWQANNPERMRIHQAKRLLADQAGVSASYIPDDLAEAKIEQLKIARWVREQNAASADTHAKRGDSTQIEAPSPMSGAVAAAQADDRRPNPVGSEQAK